MVKGFVQEVHMKVTPNVGQILERLPTRTSKTRAFVCWHAPYATAQPEAFR